MSECGTLGALIHGNPVVLAGKTLASAGLIFPVETVDAYLEGLSLGLPLDTVKYLALIVLSMPLGAAHTRIPEGTPRHVFNLVVGVLAAQCLFGVAWANLAFVGVITRLICSFAPKDMVGSVNFVVIMAYMVLTMTERLSCAWLSYAMDYTGPQMMVTIKLTSFAWNFFDGVRGRSEAEKNTAIKTKVADVAELSEAAKKDPTIKGKLRKAKLELSRLRLCVDVSPDPLRYFAWLYQFSGYVAGPAIDLTEYLRGTDRPSLKDPVTDRRSAFNAAMSKFGAGIGFLVLYQIGGTLFPVGAPQNFSCTYMGGCEPARELAPAGVLGLTGGSVLSAEFSALPFYMRLLYLFAVGLCIRFRFYFAWLTSEAAFNMAGFGYTPTSKDSAFFGLFKQWNGMTNIDPYHLETSPTIDKAMKYWNLKTQKWLFQYVYTRVKGSRATRMFATYFSSALWHGLYPGYYGCFIGAAVVQNTLGGFYKHFQDYKILTNVVTFACLNFIVMGQVQLAGPQAFHAYAAFNFYLIPLLAGLFGITKVLSGRKKAAEKNKVE